MPAGLWDRIADDPFCRRLGIRLDDLRPGYARLSMTLGPDMVNFHGVGHGGAVFALADAAHAAASNSHGIPAVALHVALHYVAPARPGDRLVAEAWEEDCGRRTALYRLEVRRAPDGRLVAAGQGRVFRQGEEGDAARPQ
ncbi:hotdog fold thioesterase [Thermaerobacter sp. PB12/4term]|uniref:hotdog fold thioesterase n=1 Tax=Thermaerobacter sp. PB12/4term TaxID=2293838 RepID=UPI000E329D79|nr:hotdog fold thioesterase [Thermaerobacter sp. PB12/4term]QIA27370.1 hotdog fold thioesterase [Thermaerobacter sp. PB12/4term]